MTKAPIRRLATQWATALLLVVGSAATGETKGGVLRVCGDPNNMPFSNEKLEGIENKLATVLAKELDSKVEYVWWPHQRGLIKRVLNTGRCDVLLGIPKGYDKVLWTKPYYRTGYVLAYRKDKIAEPLRSLDDPRLRTLTVGVQVNTPPHMALGDRGIVGANVRGYQLMFDSKFHPEEYPGKVMEDLIAGTIDVALVWGPVAGYFQKKRQASSIELVPLGDERAGTLPFAFEISMGVRKADAALRARLEKAIVTKQAEIRKILEDYGVPLLPLSPSASSSSLPRREGAPAVATRKPAGQP
jgi:mxaJ protein